MKVCIPVNLAASVYGRDPRRDLSAFTSDSIGEHRSTSDANLLIHSEKLIGER